MTKATGAMARMRTKTSSATEIQASRCQLSSARHPQSVLRSLARAHSRVLASLFFVSALLGFAFSPHAVQAQAKPAVRHSVDGTVVDAARKPIAGAVVYLENPRSLDVQSYLSDNQGHFHFNHISPQTDYEVWAEQNGVESKHRFISQFSSHIAFHFTLKLAPGAKKKFLGIF